MDSVILKAKWMEGITIYLLGCLFLFILQANGARLFELGELIIGDRVFLIFFELD
jgi:hypothetical protein